jgi:hypothetical protein
MLQGENPRDVHIGIRGCSPAAQLDAFGVNQFQLTANSVVRGSWDSRSLVSPSLSQPNGRSPNVGI